MTKKIEIPWGAWFLDTTRALTFPDHARITVADISHRPALNKGKTEELFSDLPEKLQTQKPNSVVIVVDDLTRPLKMAPIISMLSKILADAGITDEKIAVLIGGGGHRALTNEEVAQKVGRDAVERYRILEHSPFRNLTDTGVEWKGTPVLLNEHFMAADFRIVISGLVPHSFAGFSGGAKMLFPGIADIGIIKRTHKSVLMGFMGKLGEVEGNRFRAEIEGMATQIGVDYFLGLVGNAEREVVAMFSGDLIEAHRKAAAYAQAYYTSTIADAPYDMIILNAFPKDTELLQAENAFHPMHSAGKGLLKENSLIVAMSACSEGIGHHELFGPGKLLYRQPRPKRFLKGHDFVFYGDNLTLEAFHEVYDESYPLTDDWQSIEKMMSQKFSEPFKVLVFPCGSLQLANMKNSDLS